MDNAQVLFCRGYGPAQPIFIIASPKVLKLHQNHIFFFSYSEVVVLHVHTQMNKHQSWSIALNPYTNR